MEINLMFLRNGSQFLDRLNRSDFVVYHHNADEDGILADGCLQHLRLHEAFAVHIQISHFKSVLFQIFASVENRVMLDLACNDMSALFFELVCNAFQDPVVSFCPAGSKSDFSLFRVDQVRYLLPRFIHTGFCLKSYTVKTGRIAVKISIIWKHRFPYFFLNRRRC